MVGKGGELVKHKDVPGPDLGDDQEGVPLPFPKGVAGQGGGRGEGLGSVFVPQGLGLDCGEDEVHVVVPHDFLRRGQGLQHGRHGAGAAQAFICDKRRGMNGWVGGWVGGTSRHRGVHKDVPSLPLRKALSRVAWMRRRRLVGKSPPPVLPPAMVPEDCTGAERLNATTRKRRVPATDRTRRLLSAKTAAAVSRNCVVWTPTLAHHADEEEEEEEEEEVAVVVCMGCHSGLWEEAVAF